MKQSDVVPRVRFAPSPTGYLHVGGARTALFNWLYARRHGGVFVLRIEDTDIERSSADMVTGILDGLRWLGLDWDEGPDTGGPHAPYFQSERLHRYGEAAARLVDAGARLLLLLHAPTGCATNARRPRRAARRGSTTARACRSIRHGWRELIADGAPKAIRFKVPPGRPAFDDAVHGPIEFDSANIEDFVIVRSDGYPTYHLSVVVDDVDMGITLVIRGDDHISNTPKHVLLFEALGAPVPRFAHVPLILGADKKRLSKRHGATSVTEYARQGYLPAAMVNFLALLGWAPGDDRELMSKAELIESFTLEGISGGNAVFNTEKLDWMNGQYIGRMSAVELAVAVRPLLAAAGLDAHPRRRPTRQRSIGCWNCCARAPSGSRTSWSRRSRCCAIRWSTSRRRREAPVACPASPIISTRSRRAARGRAVLGERGGSGVASRGDGTRREGRRAHSRHARGGDRAYDEPGSLRSAGAARTRTYARAANAASTHFSRRGNLHELVSLLIDSRQN